MATVLWALSSMLLASAPASAQNTRCSALTPDARAEKIELTRPLVPADLVTLRDIGSIPEFATPVFALSPDRRLLAFQLRQADPVSNDFCLGMFVIEPHAGSRPRMIDTGGELIRWTFDDLLGKANFPTGFPKIITPRWFPDNRSVAFLKRTDSIVQVWRSFIDGSGSYAITNSDLDVRDFRIANAGKTVVYSTSPGLHRAQSALAEEGLSGFHYDDRFSPVASDTPFAPPPVVNSYFAVDIATRQRREARPAEVSLMSDLLPGAPTGAMAFATSPSGARAWITAGTNETPENTVLRADGINGRPILCTDPTCHGVGASLWWTRDGKSVRYIRREGWAQAETSLYEWQPGPRSPRLLYKTEDLLAGCQPYGDDFLCLRESSTHPRYLDLIKGQARESTMIFEPNPGFQRLRMGAVERLKWVNDFGVKSFGDVVYPVGYRTGQRYPLIVVQYVTRGFLRGGTGDEYPIQALANRGFAVLSLQRPQSPAIAPSADQSSINRADLRDFIDRRSVLSSIEVAVQELVKRGIVDATRVGITGLSDGSSTVQFAGLNSSLFKAAAMSDCCWERSQISLLGPAVGREYMNSGWPSFNDSATEFWSRISWAQSPERVKFPVLMQLSDGEFRGALDTFTALRESLSPVDMYVFPGETHVKWQPAHRLAIYERNLAWFDFWLRDVVPTEGRAALEASRWQRMKVAKTEQLEEIAATKR